MTAAVYYNDNDPRCCAWLRELIAASLIPPGDVDDRSITDVQAKDLTGYTQVHLFAGIGGWAYATRLADWPADEPVWTGSCPCQPFSAAGKQRAEKDQRHLWPEFRRLVAECRPPIVAGEQVASALGRRWLSGVRSDLEAMGYGVGAADLCAAGVGAPHIRQRLFWVADVQNMYRRAGECRTEKGTRPREQRRKRSTGGRAAGERASGPCGAWSDYDLLPCLDGKARRVESSTFPLADGLPGRVGLLRGYGNAVVPQLAAEFLCAFREARMSGGEPLRGDEKEGA